ncbi:transposase [Nonomuraea africana]|uniref:transposase n=1 Tax=Nonomuraea africana TaxID=46171 RepID=UPI001CEF22F0|nr:transposase [Nonomuraea africana]
MWVRDPAKQGRDQRPQNADTKVPPVHPAPQQCSACGHVDKQNRPGQHTFARTSCGFAEHADVNAARNIASRGVAGWAVSHAANDAA